MLTPVPLILGRCNSTNADNIAFTFDIGLPSLSAYRRFRNNGPQVQLSLQRFARNRLRRNATASEGETLASIREQLLTERIFQAMECSS